MAQQNPGENKGTGLKGFFDRNFGPPGEAIKSAKELAEASKELAEAFASIDQAKLKEIKSLLGSIGNVPVDIEQLRLIVEIVKLLCTVDIEKVKQFNEVLVNIRQIVKLLPKGINLSEIPIKEILQGLKQE